MKHRVEPIQPRFTVALRALYIRTFLLLMSRVVFWFSFEPRHFCALQTRRFPPVPKTHSARKEPSQESENTHVPTEELFLQFFLSTDLNLLYLHAGVPVWGTKETFRDKQSCLSLSPACFYFWRLTTPSTSKVKFIYFWRLLISISKILLFNNGSFISLKKQFHKVVRKFTYHLFVHSAAAVWDVSKKHFCEFHSFSSYKNRTHEV